MKNALTPDFSSFISHGTTSINSGVLDCKYLKYSKKPMDAARFYDQRGSTSRRLREGDGIRNTHNFLKAFLINKYVHKNAKLLDLGCGQGGDLLKLQHRNPVVYVGIDISSNAIENARSRALKIGLGSIVRFKQCDFGTTEWLDHAGVYDVVNCQFAIQYAFATPDSAHFCISRISKALRDGGMFIGSIPIHKTKCTYTQVNVTLPGDTVAYIEYIVQQGDFVELCATYRLRLLLWQSFENWYTIAQTEAPNLLSKMRAFTQPLSSYAVFAFKKINED